MKKSLLTMAAALALVSCSQDELLPNGSETVANGKIGANIFVPTTTRGAALNTVEDLISSQNGFDLISYYNDGSDNYVSFMGTDTDGIQFKHDGSAWDYADRGEIHFWKAVPDEATDMKFFAVSPAKENLPTDASYSIGTDAQTITYTVPTEVSEQKDLMFAQTDLDDGEYEPTSEVYRNGVPLNFHHALSQIVFKARIADKEDTDGNGTSNYVKAYVNSVSVQNVYGAGTFDMNDASAILGEDYYEDGDLDGMNYDNTLWTPSDDATNGYTVNNLTNNAEITWIEAEDLTNGAIGTKTAMLLLPQQLVALDLSNIGTDVNSANEEQMSVVDRSTGAYLEVNCRVEYTNNDGEVTYIVGEDAESYAKIYIPINTNWQPGYKYVYTLIFSADSGDPVKAIVESVDEWNTAAGDNNGNDDNDDSDDSNMLLLNMNAADMFVGDEIEILKHSSYSTRSSEAPLTFEIEHSDIAEVTDDNKIKAVKAGLTTVTVSCEGYEESAEVQINVLPTLKPVTLSEVNRVKTVNINPGSYTMGNTYNDEYITDAPAHSVTFTNNFYIGQYEVTVGQFVEFINANTEALKVMENYEWEGDTYGGKAVVYAYQKDGVETHKPLCALDINNITGDAIGTLSVSDEHKDLPIRCSWEGAAAFAHSVGGYLPHEEEWEYAARGGTQNKIWWMDDDNKVKDSEFSLIGSGVYFGEDKFFEADDDKIKAYETAIDLILQYENLPYRFTEDNETYTYNVGAEEPEVKIENLKDETKFNLISIGDCKKSNPWGLYNVLGNVEEWCGNYDYDYKLGIPDQVNHVVRGHIPDVEYQLDHMTSIRYTEGVDEPETSKNIWLAVVLHDFMGVAFRNVNTDMNETGFRVAFASDYSGTNSSVQTVSQGE